MPREPSAAELLNIFVQEGDQLFDAVLPSRDGQQVRAPATTSVLAEQPEFSAADRLRRLLALTETPEALGAAIRRSVQRARASRLRSALNTTTRVSRSSRS
jgi:hypothetical protein